MTKIISDTKKTKKEELSPIFSTTTYARTTIRSDDDEDDESYTANSLIIHPDVSITDSQITERTAVRFRRAINRRIQRNGGPIIIAIDTNGGDVYATLSILDTIEHIKANNLATIITTCTGKAFSAGAVILASGQVRTAAPLSTIMVHEASAAIPFSNIRDMQVDMEETERLNGMLLDLLCKYMSPRQQKRKQPQQLLTPKFLRESLFQKKRDIYLTPEQALKLGLIDKVGYPEIRLTTSVEIF